MNSELVELTAEATDITVDQAAEDPRRSRLSAVHGFAALFGLSLALAVLGRDYGNEALALCGGYGVIFFGIGSAPFQLRRDMSLWARLTVSVLVGFSVLLCAGALMADIRGLWDPVAAAIVIGVPVVLLHIIGVSRAIRPASVGRGRWRALPSWEAEAGRSEWFSLLLTLAGTGLWLGAAISTRDPHPGYWGMLRLLGPAWYAGLVAVVVGFALGRRRELSAALATLSFGLATTLTPALVYAAPREDTASKQMQLTQYVLSHHHIHVTAGIYQAYSSMFAGVGALSELLRIHGLLGHMSLLQVATYWPVLLVLMRVAELRFLSGRLLASTGRRWTMVMLALLVDSLGTDYYSPQSIGYIMALAMIALAIRGLGPRPLGTRATFCLLLFGGIALGPTHELSPYMAAGALVILALFRQAPWWSSLPVGLPAVAWAGYVHNAVQKNFSFGALFNLSNFRPPVTVATPGLHRLAIVGVQSHVLLLALLLLIALGAVGFFANIRRRWAWAYALCPVVGIGFIAINPYGNEGIFRATLFAIPWMAVLAMKVPEPAGRLRALSRRGLGTVAVSGYLVVLLGTFIIAAYSMDGTSVLRRGDLAAVRYLMGLPRRDAFVLGVGSASNPTDGANFALNYTTLEWSQVANVPELRRLHPTAIDPVALADRYGIVAHDQGARPTSPLYLVWSRSSLLYTNAYGLQSTSQMDAWLRLVQRSAEWRLVYHSGNTYLFRLI